MLIEGEISDSYFILIGFTSSDRHYTASMIKEGWETKVAEGQKQINLMGVRRV